MSVNSSWFRRFSLRLSPAFAPMLCLGLLAGLASFSPGVLAVDTTWNGGTGDWFDDANWDTGNVPTSTDAAFIPTGTAQVQGPGAEASDLTLSSGTLEVDGGSITTSGMIVGELSGDSGTLTISNSGTVDTLFGDLGLVAGSFGEATVTGSGSIWTTTIDIQVGNGGSGRLTIEAGGAVENGDIAYIAHDSGSSGEVTVTGSGSTWHTAFDTRVGDQGDGVLTIEDGGSVSNDEDGVIGRLSTSSGEATVTGIGSSWTSGEDMHVGDQGSGTLTIEDGGSVSNTDGYIALTGGTSTATVTGAGSTWANSGDLYVGEGGSGTLTIDDGGEVSALAVTLANGTAGALNLSGTSSSRGFIETSQITEGVGNTGTIDFTGGGVRITVNQAGLFSGFETGDVTLGAGGGVIDTQNFTATISMVLDGSGGLIKEGSGTLTLSGANTFAGGLTVEDGTLTRSVAGGFVSNSAVTVNGGTLSLNNIAFTASSLSGDGGTVGMGSATLTVNQSGNTTYEGVIAGTGSFIKQGTGTLTLTGDSTFSANATVNAGTVNVDGGSFTQGIGDMRVGLSNGDSGTLIIENGGSITNELGRVGEASGSFGAVTVDGTGSLWDNSGTLFVGNSGTGEMTISAGGEVESTEGRLGDAVGGDGEATVTGTDSLWEMSLFLLVGNNGTGTLAIEDGGEVRSTTGGLGNGAAGDGAVTVTGTGSFWDMSSLLLVGNNGAGTLAIEDGGEVENTSAILGDAATGSGTATVTGADSLWEMSSFLRVGNNGEATLSIEDGGEVRSTEGHIGNGATGDGEATVTGAGSLWQMSSFLLVGNNGVGTLTVADGGEVQNTIGVVGNVAASDGAATVTGADSLWQVSSYLQVGNNGAGTLTIEDGGEVRNTLSTLGDGATADGEATVTGSGSLWQMSAQLVIGQDGTGTMTIEDGATVENTFARVGEDAGSSGEVTITGAGSLWDNSDSLFVGNAGTGVMTISDGGEVANTEGRIGDAATGFGEVTVTGTGSLWEVAGTLYVSNIGTGSLTVEDDGEVHSQATRIGNSANGTLSIGSSGELHSTDGFVGVNSTGVGDASVAGADSLWQLSATLSVGNGGLGELTISGGGEVNNASGFIGTGSTGDGEVTVTGTGSLWDNSGVLWVASEGTGALMVEDGGRVAASFVLVGVNAGSSGAVLLDGGTLETSQVARVDGTGTLDFDDGVLRLTQDEANLFEGFAAGDISLAAGGGVIDVQTFTAGAVVGFDGAGGLSKQGSGTLNLGATSTYSGGTLVEEGTLGILTGNEVGSGTVTLDGATLAFNGASSVLANDIQINADGGTLNDAGSGIQLLGGAITLDGDLLLDGANVIVLTGDIGGTGALTADMSNAAVIVGDAAHAGGTTVNSGILQIGGGGTTGSVSGDIVNDSDLIFFRSDSFTHAGAVSGTGDLAKAGAGTLTLSGDLGYSGNTLIAAGTLVITGDTAALGGDIGNDAALVFDQAADSAFGGMIAGTGTVAKSGAGTLTLTGTSDYSGATTVNGGTLAVNGSILSTTTVNTGGTLGGSGIVGSVFLNGGSFAPGNSIGTTMVAGDVDFSAGGTYEVELNAAGESDLIDATGSATLSGGSVEITAESGEYDPITAYLILSADGGILGEFDSVSSNLTFLAPQLSYDSNNVFLTLFRNDVAFASLAATPNQRAVAGALDAQGPLPGGEFQDVMNALLLLNPGQARVAFDRLSGVQHTHGLHVARQALRGLARLSFGRLGGGGRDPGISGLSLAFSDQPWAQQLEQNWLSMFDGADGALPARGFWVRGYGAWGGIDGDGNAVGADYSTAGLGVGLDAEFGERWTAGVAGGYADSDTDSGGGELEGESFQLAAYAGFNDGAWHAHGLIGHAWHEVDSTRDVNFGGFASVSEADYDMTTFSAALEVGYDFNFSEQTTLTPFAALEYARMHRESFTESGAAGLAVDGQTEHSLRPTFGLRLAHALAMDNGAKLEPVLYAAYAREVLDSVSRVQGSFANAVADGFLIDGPETDRDRFLAGAAMNTRLTQRAHLTLAWDAELTGSDTAHALSATFRYRW